MRFPEDYRGKVVLVDFWATWCLPCRTEIPHLVDAYQKYKDRGFEILGLTLDTVSSTQVMRFAEQEKMRWEQIQRAAQRIASDFGVREIPAPFLIDGDTGKILASGDALRGKALLATIEKNLKGK